jgi:hypothetical protein
MKLRLDKKHLFSMVWSNSQFWNTDTVILDTKRRSGKGATAVRAHFVEIDERILCSARTAQPPLSEGSGDARKTSSDSPLHRPGRLPVSGHGILQNV